MTADSSAVSLHPGASVGFFLIGSPVGVPALHVIGVSDRSYGGVPLPLDLGPIGAPGCHLYTDVVGVTTHVTDVFRDRPTGEARFFGRVPLAQEMLGAVLFSQWLVVEPGANPLGLTVSNGVRVELDRSFSGTGLSIVSSPDPQAQTGVVRTHLFPVMRLVAR